MIGRIAGQLLIKNAPDILVDVQGAGYEIQVPMSTFFELPNVDQKVVLLTHLVVREDAQLLYGFYTAEERRMFRQLLKISGVGAKLALAILSGMPINSFIRCVAERDVTALTKIPGVGKKTAERLLVELADKLDLSEFGSSNISNLASPAGAEAEATTALEALGYKAAEIKKLLAKRDLEGKSVEDIIRLALQQAMSR